MSTPHAQPKTPPPLTVYYDCHCAFCRQSIAGLKRIHQSRSHAPVIEWCCLETAASDPRMQGVSSQALRRRMQAVDSNGRCWEGIDAIHAILQRGPFWCAPFGWIYQLPGARWVLSRLYDWVADNRYRLVPCQSPNSCGPVTDDKPAVQPQHPGRNDARTQ
ncbi:MAG: DUF393 domain-containing protein [Candidatus Melainabacteria bacterium]|nr:DUF393 domain-containing protein [Candidatus Melainabacteria bacterium]